MENRTISEESLLKAAKFYFAGDKDELRQFVHEMYKEQPAILEFVGFLDVQYEHIPTKVIILQLMTIFYYAISIQQIKMAKISYSDFMDAIDQNIKMKEYYDDPDETFDVESFKVFFDNYPQQELMRYTNIALENQYNTYITEERDASRIFFIMKIFGEVVDLNIRKC